MIPVATCEVDGCERDAKARGLCALHYLRMRRTGEVGSAQPGTKGAPPTLVDRVHVHVNLERHQVDQLDARAAQRNVSRSELVREAVEEWLSDD